MKNLSKYIICCITLGTILYLLFSFVQNELNFTKWSMDTIGGIAVLFAIVSVAILPAFFNEDNNDKH
jgi:hypothetical protein